MDKSYFVAITFKGEGRGPKSDITCLWARSIDNPTVEQIDEWIHKGEGYAFASSEFVDNIIKSCKLKYDPFDSGMAGWLIFKKEGSA